nr:protein kinase [Planctomycetota bacterium]
NIFDRSDSVCADFRREWKVGKRPRIEGYLPKVPENAREQLFRNLLPIDIRYRERNGEKPQSGDYLGQFPRYKRVIGDRFNFSTSIEMQAMQSTPADDSADLLATIEAPAANRIGDYELICEIGRGGFGVVYEAKHVTRRNRVALKTLPTGQNGQEVNAERLHKFRREFRSLSEVNHPNLVGMQSLEVDGGQWFFTMDLIEGEDFLSYVRPGGKLDESRLRESLKQLVAGVIALHEQRILHRDLKPSNVLVGPDGRVSILDFGLVAQLEQRTDQTASMQTQHFAGTPRYAAPEQVFGQRSPATDWYAVGTMLFESLTGEAPYRGAAAELFMKKQDQDPPQLAEREDLPEDLASLTDQLLRRAPDERPTSEGIAEALALEMETVSHYTHGSHDDETAPTQLADDSTQILIGREEQLTQLEDAKQAFLRDRQPEVVWIAGLSGEGKSSLAEKFLAPLRRSVNELVLSGRCYDRESVPFKAVDVLVEALVSFLRARSRDQVNAWLPPDIELLARLFPTLRRVGAIEDRSQAEFFNLDDRQVRYRAFFALRHLLVNISGETPIVFFIDDLQWGDADSAEVLVELLSPPDPPAVLLLGSYRSDEAGQSPFLQEWERRSDEQDGQLSGRRVEVTPLTEEQCAEFVAQTLGIDAEELRSQAQATFADTKGNPYFLEQLIEGFNAETREFEPVPLHDILERKLKQLPTDARELLQVIAIAGQAVSIEEASSVSGYDTPLFSTVTHMRSERLVRLIGSDRQQSVDTYHDKIRETVVENMGTVQRRGLHLAFAEMIEQGEDSTAADLLDSVCRLSTPGEYQREVSPRVFDLAHHFHRAKDNRAFVYQLVAAEQAFRAYAVEDASAYYETVRMLVPENSPSMLQHRIWIAMGRVHQWNKNNESALQAFERAVDCASDNLDRARAYTGMANVFRQCGGYDSAISQADNALKQLGTSRPKTAIGKLVSFAGNSFRILAIPASWQVAKTKHRKDVARLKQLVTDSSGQDLLDKDILATLDTILRQSVCAMQTGDPTLIAIGYAQAATIWTLLGIPWCGGVALRRSRRANLDQVDLESRGYHLYYQGLASYWEGDLERAGETFSRAASLLRRCHSLVNLQVCLHMHRHVLAYIGSASSELDMAKAVLRVATETGNAQGLCWGSYDVASALARKGELPAAFRHMQQANSTLTAERYYMTEAIRASTDAYVRLQSSDYTTANQLARFAWKLVVRKLISIDVAMLCLPILIESISGPQWLSPLSIQDRRTLRRLLRMRLAVYTTQTNLRPHLLRVTGRAYSALGNKRKAIPQFQKAVRIARRKGMDYQRARGLLDLAALKKDGREDNRAEAIELLKKMESVIPYAESWLLGDQYDESVVAPDFDLEAWERENGSVRKGPLDSD